MAVYSEANYTNLIYSTLLREQKSVSVNSKNSERKVNHDLKLLTNEIIFICKYVEYNKDKKIKIIYMGAAPGFHLTKLLPMFDFIYFDLYDPEPLHTELQKYIMLNNDKITYFNEKFTTETCSRYENSDFEIYLITDHRDVKYNTDPIFQPIEGVDINLTKHNYQMEKEQSYINDMELQMQICKILKPKCSNLRFRPPHFYDTEYYKSPKPAIFSYFSGTIWLLIYNELKGTEGRLVVNNYEEDNFSWNYESYQFRLNYFNTVIRESLLSNPFHNNNTPLPNQLGNKYEVVILFKILIEYFLSIGYIDPRVNDVMSLYTNFIIKETCINYVCDMKNIENEETKEEVNDNDNFDVNQFEDEMMF